MLRQGTERKSWVRGQEESERWRRCRRVVGDRRVHRMTCSSVVPRHEPTRVRWNGQRKSSGIRGYRGMDDPHLHSAQAVFAARVRHLGGNVCRYFHSKTWKPLWSFDAPVDVINSRCQLLHDNFAGKHAQHGHEGSSGIWVDDHPCRVVDGKHGWQAKARASRSTSDAFGRQVKDSNCCSKNVTSTSPDGHSD